MMIVFQAQLLLSLVNDLLDLDQIQSGVYQSAILKFDPNEVIKLVKTMFSTQAEAKRIKLITSVFECRKAMSRTTTSEYMDDNFLFQIKL